MNKKKFATAMRENVCKDKNGCIICSPQLWEQIASIIESQETEIERLEADNPHKKYGNCVIVGDALIFTKTLKEYDKLLHDIGREGIKEFAARVKSEIPIILNAKDSATMIILIDSLVKVFTERSGGNA